MRINKNQHKIWTSSFILFLLAVAAFFIFMFAFPNNPILNRGKYHGFETGKTADRDIYVYRTITYIDDDATEVRIEAETRLIPPVFVIQEEITSQVRERFEIFSAVFSNKFPDSKNAETMFLEIQSVLPGVFSSNEISLIYNSEQIIEVLPAAGEVLTQIMEDGVADIPDNLPGKELARIEIWNWDNDLKSERTESLEAITTRENIEDKIEKMMLARGFSGKEMQAGSIVVQSLAEENLFYDAEATEKSKAIAEREVEPVYRTLLKNERLIKRGYRVTAEDMKRIEALNKVSKRENLFAIFSSIVVIVIMYLLAVLFFKPPITVRRLDRKSVV